ncbi:NAD(P)-binding domain-containing protein [Paenibacillus chitinolyticus]|uniref:NAD(P)-binding domain-containing protein n=1 Tax=Paenibacillus chitinolyticus TaxID=79263 RepID=UPI003651DBC0
MKGVFTMNRNAHASENRKSVTVIGLGPMGQAMAGVYLERGYQVTVWNRTPDKADELAARVPSKHPQSTKRWPLTN